ncbi:hypothetical protein MLD38_017012 [Melastoma candidum]|uniref:Uncharacterized protein n=1 Tax=Melastoma candidum TaxID=119954 RepID=A0ACB9QR61_9MYRT|nr:hypothetical protein MLD38_017012 [Melastoma candidum]
MANVGHSILELPEQICYVQCGFCSTILLVSVPCSSLAMVVTVRCGHCTSLLSVNMTKASFIPLHLFTSLNNHDEPKNESLGTEEEKMTNPRHSPTFLNSFDYEDEDYLFGEDRVVNKPPEKRQRAPSAYNRFIKEEIGRLKSQNPKMAHKEAFSQAAKNWAQFPQCQAKVDGVTLEKEEAGVGRWAAGDTIEEGEGKGCRQRKVPRHFIWEKTPFS